MLFESSGMYRGEDLVALISPLMSGRLDAVWGSRRLSVNDIEASYRLRYHHKALLGSISYVGSHVLSAAYLLLFGRYISDTLSGVRAVRAGFLTSLPVAPDDKLANQYLLSRAASREGRRARDAGAVLAAVARARAPDDAGRRPAVAGASSRGSASRGRRRSAALAAARDAGRFESVPACAVLTPS